MNRILFRIVPLTLAAAAVASLALYFLLRVVFGDPLEDIARQQASGPIFLLEQYIDQAPADEWLARLNRVREVSDLSMDILPLNQVLPALPEAKQEVLRRGELVLDIPGKAFFRRVDLKGERYVASDEDVLRVSRLPLDVGLEVKMEAVRYAVVAFCLLVPLAWWSRAHWRELLALSRVATAFGAGKLSVRASTSQRAAVYPLAQCMNQMADQIQSHVDAQRQLLHAVSHELRTPIARMEFSLALLRDREEGADSRLLEKRIVSMEDDLAELNSLVNELLSLNRLDHAPSLNIDMLDAADFMQSCTGRLDHVLAGKHLSIEDADAPTQFAADNRLLGRAVGNLLENAAKYAHSQIKVHARREGQHLIILIEDDGPGIPEAEREQVFMPFYRLDRSRDRASGGFGLGLAIARKAVRLHGGDIEADASPLGGTRMRLWLPIAQA